MRARSKPIYCKIRLSGAFFAFTETFYYYYNYYYLLAYYTPPRVPMGSRSSSVNKNSLTDVLQPKFNIYLYIC